MVRLSTRNPTSIGHFVVKKKEAIARAQNKNAVILKVTIPLKQGR